MIILAFYRVSISYDVLFALFFSSETILAYWPKILIWSHTKIT